MNFRLISETVAYATRAGELVGKRVDFSMTTNATYLTPEIIHFLRDHRVGVAVSIDGPKKFHDLRRTYKNGMGSYDMIEPRIMNLLREHKTRPVAARVTLTHGVTAVSEIFDHLTGMGFDEVGFAPVTSSDDDNYALTPEEFWQVLEEFGKLTANYVDGVSSSRRPRFSNLTNLLADLHQGVIKAYPCGAGLGLLGVGSTGKLYLCHRFLESDEHQVGTLATGVDRARQAEFMAATHLSAKPPCQICWVRNICSGGCHHEGYKRYGTLGHATTHRCEWIRAWINMGLHAYVEIMGKEPSVSRSARERGCINAMDHIKPLNQRAGPWRRMRSSSGPGVRKIGRRTRHAAVAPGLYARLRSGMGSRSKRTGNRLVPSHGG